jgi:hypothetical protein
LLRSLSQRPLPLPYPRQKAPDSSILFRGKGTAVLRTGRMLTLHPFEGRAGALRCTCSDFNDIAISGAPTGT